MRLMIRMLPPVALLLAAAAMGHAADIAVGTAAARPGQKATGVIRVPAGVDAGVEIPVIVIQGAKPGPTLALLAGAHGTEYASIIALEKLARSTDPAALSGALIVVPLLNVASFLQKVPHLNPVDGKNMNRLYPGKADGTQTERALWAVTRQVLDTCDYLIDYHGGDLDENLRRYSYWADTGNGRLDAASRAMVLAFGLDHIIIQRNRPGDPNPSRATTITRQAQNMGKPSIAVEAGHAGTTAAGDVDALVGGTENVMRQLKMLPGTAAPVEHPLWIGRYSVIASDRDGIFYPLAVPEAYVTKGMTIGYVTDFFGEKIWEVTAPVSGVIIYIGAVPSMKKGDNVAYIGEIVAEP
ncbi:MAG: succinylglutamate desuccinylase/aspartoacylase family protein [Acidobacteriia bacterium]|nr:succinylglutamate desuccinylase/aspartoacylase family protein [Terriglobia bacterium]